MTETWFTADIHFGHKFIADWRGFGRENLAEHDELMRDNWIAQIGPKDTVHFLGDFSFGDPVSTMSFFLSLPGHKNLIVGNHDNPKVKKLPWASANELKKISINGQSIVLCHYPMLTWQNAHHGTWHLHGHTHGNLRVPDTTTRMDVGVDCSEKYVGRKFSPISFDEISFIMSDREYDFVDHHDGGEAARNGTPQVMPERNKT